MKKILLLGGSAQQVVAIERAKQLGYETILCDFLPDNPGQYTADKFYLVSTTDMTLILDIARKEEIAGILAYASDPAAPTAAFVAEQLGLPGNPFRSVEILCNKDKFRDFLHKEGFHAPVSYGYGDSQSAIQDISRYSLPVIVKPVDSSGSKGATVLRSLDGLEDAVAFAFSFSRGHRIIIEEFIEKKHPYLIGGDIFVVNGKIVLWGLLNCHRDTSVNPLVPVGKSYPLQLEAADMDQVKKMLSAMVSKLGICNGAMNVELVVDKNGKVWPIDVGPRCGGNMIPNLLGDMFGVDVVEMSILAAMGQTPVCDPKVPACCFATHNLHSNRAGSYENITFDTELDTFIYRKCLYKKAGDPVEFFDNAAKCLGIVFLRFPDQNIMNRYLSNISNRIQIHLAEEK